jgi:hypothetical protein
MIARPTAVVTALRKNLAKALNKQPSALDPADMEAFFTRQVPLGNYVGLTYMSFLLAKLWQQAEVLDAALSQAHVPEEVTRAAARLHMDIGLGCTFAEQVAVEGGARYQLGWLLTGMEEPPFSAVQQNKPRPGTLPHGKLVEAQWVAAQLAYLKDLDVMFDRMKKQSGQQHRGWKPDDKPK